MRSTSSPIRAASSNDFPPPNPDLKYPVVGIIDSGTAINDPYLSPWRHAREVYVPASDQDHSHGSFVSGLIVHAQSLNHKDARFPSCSARFLDVVALSKSGTTEDKLLAVLEDVLGKYPNVKVCCRRAWDPREHVSSDAACHPRRHRRCRVKPRCCSGSILSRRMRPIRGREPAS